MRVFTGCAGFMALVYAGLSGAAQPAAAPKADLERGRQIAATVCAACHGEDGNSVQAANPVLAGQHAEYIAAQLAAFKSGARVNPIMAGMSASLTPEDMRNVGAWYASRKPAPRAAKDAALAKRGKFVWQAGVKAAGVPACSGCHGAAGKGIPVQYPRLAGQHPELTYAWLQAFANGTRAHTVMSGVAAKMTDADMKAVSEFIAGLH